MKRAIWGSLLALAGCGVFDRSSNAAEPEATMEGAVCGSPLIKGTNIGAVPGPGQCGIDEAVQITEVAGVRLSQPARIDCQTAQSVLAWVQDGVKPAVGRRGGGVASMRVMASYACRTRNHRSGARLSEHSFGHAIDIGGITLADGEVISVLDHWSSASSGAILKQMHAAACGPFGTVLGPDADVYHKNHFHFDTARYRSGSYCR